MTIAIASALARALLLATAAALVWQAWRYRDSHRLDIFAFVFALVLVQFLPQGQPGFSLLWSLAVAAEPLLLLRLVLHFREVPAALVWLAVLNLVVAPLGWMLWPADVPFVYFAALVNGNTAVLASFAALAFSREAGRTAGVTRRRLSYAAVGSWVFAIGLLVSGAGAALGNLTLEMVLTPIITVVHVPIYLCYFLAFATPRWLASRWQQIEQARYVADVAAREPSDRGDQAATDLSQAAARSVSHSLVFVALRPDLEDGPVRLEASTDARLEGQVLEPHEGLIGRALASHMPMRGAASAAHSTLADRLRQAGQSALVAPIVTPGRVWGVVVAVQRRGSLFPDDDLALLSAFARHAGIALDHARLIREARERERAFADRQIREVESRMGLMLDSIKDYAMIIVDDTGRVAHWPVGAGQIFGYREAEVAGEPAAPLFALSEDRFDALLDEARTLGLARREGPCRRRDGARFLGSTVIRPLDGAAAGFVAVTRDDTERRALEDRLRQSQKMEAIGQLAGGIAHDFNNLLTAILGYADWLAGGLPSDDPHRPQVAEIQRAAERGAGLTRKLLTFSRGQMLEPVPINLARLVDEMMPMLRRVIGNHIEIVQTSADELAPVLADRTQLEQVVLNLAVNARDAMPTGGTLTIATAIVWLDDEEAARETTPGRFVRLEVADTGAGMDQATLARIFEPFFTTKAPGQGTGLGLATVYGIVRQMGGVIRVTSTPGAGSTFRLFLPEATGDARPPAAAPEPELAGSETVLVVEDDDAVRRFIGLVLRQHGYTVLEAADQASAMVTVDGWSGGVDLIIADVLMPRGTGPDLVRALAQDLPDTPALFISGYADAVLAREATVPKASHFLQKPFSAVELLARIRQLLGSPRP